MTDFHAGCHSMLPLLTSKVPNFRDDSRTSISMSLCPARFALSFILTWCPIFTSSILNNFTPALGAPLQQVRAQGANNAYLYSLKIVYIFHLLLYIYTKCNITQMRTARRLAISRSNRESKPDRFRRIAERRVTEALRVFRLIGNLSNRNNYEYTDAEVRQILDALEGEMRRLKQRFQQEETGGGNTFSFRK